MPRCRYFIGVPDGNSIASDVTDRPCRCLLQNQCNIAEQVDKAICIPGVTNSNPFRYTGCSKLFSLAFGSLSSRILGYYLQVDHDLSRPSKSEPVVHIDIMSCSAV